LQFTGFELHKDLNLKKNYGVSLQNWSVEIDLSEIHSHISIIGGALNTLIVIVIVIISGIQIGITLPFMVAKDNASKVRV